MAGEHVWPVPPLSLPKTGARWPPRPTRRRWRSSSSARGRRCRASRSITATPPPSPRSAGGSTGCRSRSSSPRRGCERSRPTRSRAASPPASSCWRRPTAPSIPGTARSRRPSTGASTCSTTRSASSCARLSVFAGELLDRGRRARLLVRRTAASSACSIVLMALVDRSLVVAEPSGRGVPLPAARDRAPVRAGAPRPRRRPPSCASSTRATFLDLAEQAEPHIFGGAASADWIGRLEAELRQPARRDRLGAARRVPRRRRAADRCRRSTGSGSRAADCAKGAARWRARSTWAPRERPSRARTRLDRARTDGDLAERRSRWCAPRWRRASRCSRTVDGRRLLASLRAVRSRHRAHDRRRDRGAP